MGKTSDTQTIIGTAVVAGVLWWIVAGTVWQFTPIAAAAVVGVIVVKALKKKGKDKR